MMLGSVFITAAGIYLLYRAYNVGVKKEISTKDNPNLPKDRINDIEGYCKFLSRMFNLLGLLCIITGFVSFLDDLKVIKLGNYIYLLFGVLFVVVIIWSIILNKLLRKYY